MISGLGTLFVRSTFSHPIRLYYIVVCSLVGARRGRVSIRLIDKNFESECGFESVSVKLTTKVIMLPVDAKPQLSYVLLYKVILLFEFFFQHKNLIIICFMTHHSIFNISHFPSNIVANSITPCSSKFGQAEKTRKIKGNQVSMH